MRLMFIAATAVALAACASTPPTKPPAEKPPMAKASAPAGKTKGAEADKFAVIDASNIAEAQAAGWKVVDNGGTPLYCRKEQITGTRVAQRTTCLTAAEIQERAAQGRDAMTPKQVPYIGTPGR